MKPSSLIYYSILGCALVLSGCARTETHLWHSFLQKESSRKPAQTAANSRPRCFVDRFNDAAIQDEVNTFKQQYANARTQNYTSGDTRWTALPRSTVDVLQQKNYLNVSGRDSWFTTDIRQKDCTDLTCFSNDLYAAPTSEGLLHYWYFLKTGYAMAATDAYPWYSKQVDQVVNVSGVPLESYLFNKNEWKAFWLQANLLPKPMLHMPDLQSIHRLPANYKPDEWKVSGTCGWSVGTYQDGIILLGDECLPLNATNIFDTSSFFYLATTHEQGHRYSAWNLGRRNLAYDGMDADPEFLAISQWSTEELVGADGKTTRQWKLSGDTTEWISDYAKTSPHEDFAESVGHYRNEANLFLKKAPTKYAYFKKNAFDGIGYALPDLKANYAKKISDAVKGEVADWATPCLSATPGQVALTSAQTQIANGITIDLPLEPAVVSCLKQQFALTVTQALSEIRYQEPEGCTTLDANGVQNDVIAAALPDAVSGVTGFLQTDHRIADLIGGVQNFRASVSAEFDAKTLFLSCYGQADSTGCFQTKLGSEFDRLYQKYKVQLTAGSDALMTLERDRFIRLNGYSDTEAKITVFFGNIFSPFTSEIDESSLKVWQNCALATPDFTVTDAPTEPYSAGAHYMAQSMLKCLNVGALAVEADIRGKAAVEQGVEVFTDEAKSWINGNILFPKVKTVFEASVKTAEQAEKTKLDQASIPASSSALSDLTTNLSWETHSGVYTLPDCRIAATQKLTASLSTTQYFYTAMDQALTPIVDSVCESVRVAVRANYQRNISSQDTGAVSAAQMAALDPVWSALIAKVKAQVQTRYSTCRSGVHFGNSLKRFCLFSQPVKDADDNRTRQAWYWAVHRAVDAWVVNPATVQLLSAKGFPDELAKTIASKRLENERQNISESISADFFR